MIDFTIPGVYIIDDFVPEVFQDYLYKNYSKKAWYFLDGIDGETSYRNKELQNFQIDPNNPILDNIEEQFQFVWESFHLARNIFREEDINPLFFFHYLQLHTNFQYNFNPQRCKINLQTNAPHFKKTSHNAPHTDLGDSMPNHWTMIYYVNDSDGDTLIFNETPKYRPVKNFTINKKISPKRGRAIIFPGDRFHCGTTPIISKARIVANLNFLVNPSVPWESPKI